MSAEWAIRRFAELSPGLAVEITGGPGRNVLRVDSWQAAPRADQT